MSNFAGPNGPPFQHPRAAGLPNRQDYAVPPLPHHHFQHRSMHVLSVSSGGIAFDDGALPPDLRRGSMTPSVGETAPGLPVDDPLTTPSPASNHGHNTLQPSPPGGAGSLTPKPIRRRMRMITSCLECRRRKLKCNKSNPCHNCLKFSRDCLYLGPKLDEASQLRLTEMKEKVGSLERALELEVKSTAKGAPQAMGAGLPHQGILADGVGDELEGDSLELTPMVALDGTYEDDVEVTGMDDLIDLGIKIGKMRITERIGGLTRPRLSEELLAGLSSSTPPGYTPQALFDSFLDPTGQVMNLPDYLRPGASYIAPTGGSFFGQVSQVPDLLELLPNIELGDRLIGRYFKAVHPVARCVHRSSFESLYNSFREDYLNYIEPRPSTQAVVFAALFSAAVSLDEADVDKAFGLPKAALVTKMKLGTESALNKAHFLRTTKVETLQAFVMYLLPLCREEVSRAHSVLVGTAVRMAECMGLHRDGAAYGLSPLETHVRRLIWHQLCFLDIRTCEAQGPKPAIRREDYDTCFPINCEEDQLTAAGPAPAPVQGWTSTLLSIVRFEINEMMRTIWLDRRKLESRKVSLTAMLTKIENFRKAMALKYNSFLDDSVPIQKYTKLVMHLLTCRLHAMVLHPYHSNTNGPMPERLKNLLVVNGVTIIETAIQLERNPFFRDWRWYIGAYQQYQIALLLMTEIFYRPSTSLANRIWACLDYVFELDPNLDRGVKSLQVLTEIKDRTAVYTSLRKMRAPTAMVKAIPDRQAVKHSPPIPGLQPQQQYQQMMVPALKPEGGACGAMPPQVPATCALHLPSHHEQSGMPAMGMAYSQGLPQMALPSQNMVFGGVSDGEILWGFPPGNSPSSPENSEAAGSPEHLARRHGSLGGTPGLQSSIMSEIDWGQMDELFPPDFNFNMFAPTTNALAPSTQAPKWN